MKYLTPEQVKRYIDSWLRYVANQPMSQPRHYVRLKSSMRATLRLPSPTKTKGETHE